MQELKERTYREDLTVWGRARPVLALSIPLLAVGGVLPLILGSPKTCPSLLPCLDPGLGWVAAPFLLVGLGLLVLWLIILGRGWYPIRQRD
jgi:hypothetical protein